MKAHEEQLPPTNEFNAPDTHAQSISDDGMDFIEEIGDDKAAQGNFAHIDHDKAIINTSDDATSGSSTTTIGQSFQHSTIKRARDSTDDESLQTEPLL
ncbi:hypothetical protein HYFRA_00012248 [Hymenoscyphus fraxineus]|uniref:Uncharacterized protein n=1 Tax=Hymenoscyphus fraxineus TaxID=746836 RepID=A0A9N9PK62_9HELO|nr:hypothetical protein HYFRA_00012248 [Hymenoscyphus fraxineus]